MAIVVRWEKREPKKVSQTRMPRNHSSGGETSVNRLSSKTRKDVISPTEKWPLTLWEPQEDLSSILPEKIQACFFEW